MKAKLKTHRAAAKRYKVTASGKIQRRKAGKKHLLGHKSPARNNRLSSMVALSETHEKMVSKELPYKKYAK